MLMKEANDQKFLFKKRRRQWKAFHFNRAPQIGSSIACLTILLDVDLIDNIATIAAPDNASPKQWS